MGLLSKLFGNDKEAEKAAKDIVNGLNDLFGSAAAQGGQKPAQQQSYQPEQRSYTAPVQEQPVYEEGPSGDSWGPNMPAEPNQYNYYGAFWEYFEDIFHRDFAEYTVTRQENPRTASVYAYSFSMGGETLLMVELLSRRNDVYKLRSDCRKQGIPYLRFYYDVEGWWNTRAYVIDRVRKALNR